MRLSAPLWRACHIITGTGLTPRASALGLGSPLPTSASGLTPGCAHAPPTARRGRRPPVEYPLSTRGHAPPKARRARRRTSTPPAAPPRPPSLRQKGVCHHRGYSEYSHRLHHSVRHPSGRKACARLCFRQGCANGSARRGRAGAGGAQERGGGGTREAAQRSKPTKHRQRPRRSAHSSAQYLRRAGVLDHIGLLQVKYSMRPDGECRCARAGSEATRR